MTDRRYDMDWLRIIAFGLLILYHCGMFYVTWDWHVKSSSASDAIEPLMLLFMPIAVNVCYTVGWPVEIVLRKLRSDLNPKLGEFFFRVGLIFSFALISLPAVVWSVIWLFS